MTAQTYTANQVYDALIRQGYSERQARAMAVAIGDTRATSSQVKRGMAAVGAEGADLPSGKDGELGSSFYPNLGEGIGGGLGYYLATRKLPEDTPKAPKAKEGLKEKLASPLRDAKEKVKSPSWKKRTLRGLGGTLPGAIVGGTAGELLSGTNFYDRATGEQVAADIGGSIVGGALGEKAAAGLAKLGSGRLAGTMAGRALGGALGGPMAPITSLIGGAIGGALGGWGLSEAMPDESKSVEEEEEEKDKKFYNPF